MNSLLEQSKERVSRHYHLHEDTILVLDASTCQWIARVTTNHLAERGEPEETFVILVQQFDFMFLGNEALQPLGEWCAKQGEQ